MRISELAATTDVAVPTIKYYLREGLLPEGVRTAATQAEYGPRHIERLRVIRALVAAGVSVAEIRKVVTALDAPPAGAYDLLGVAHAAVTPAAPDDIDTGSAEALYERLGGRPGTCEPRLLGGLAVALATVEQAGFTVPSDVMDEYVASARRIAEAEIAGIPGDSLESAVRYVVLGTVLTEPLQLALRRAAQQIVSSDRFSGGV
ncbi:DNA-binding transcriptional MerR regulator [Microbacterium sp. AK009]|uniref:MerR family transcriptional regulator n=1 Tax=Microbacterium sp. AK009 TaxID=2723068 RepID=UPI0015C8980C|nr:MerR family transcriptional regulator [Microbacterium sp. AK009]NYF16982.1 DNA-binding transcriptional MerR regulator [Microbacterium sp. AK009]